jgi:hypothetical protein
VLAVLKLKDAQSRQNKHFANPGARKFVSNRQTTALFLIAPISAVSMAPPAPPANTQIARLRCGQSSG